MGIILLLLALFIKFMTSNHLAASASFNCSNGTIEDCHEEEEMMMMESEMSRRIMAEQRKFISPGALRRDKPVCNGGGGGEAYSGGCLPPPSNPQTRGCSRYYRCRSDSWEKHRSLLIFLMFWFWLFKFLLVSSAIEVVSICMFVYGFIFEVYSQTVSC